MSRLTQAIFIASGIGMWCAQGVAIAAAQSQDSKTVRISRDDPAARALVEPAAKTQQELEKLGPLDWTKTVGKPRRVEPSAEELKALADAKPQWSEGGPPDKAVEEEAMRAQATQEQDQQQPPRQ